MKKFLLRGLAEGLIGHSSIRAKGIKDVFVRYPALDQVKEKLVVNNNTISGFSACDG